MCVLVNPSWLQYECGHFALRNELPWWIEPCTSPNCVHSPMHEDPCPNCQETCAQELEVSPNIIMTGGVNYCEDCERGMNQRGSSRDQRER
ncbi:hypothetical protein PISMIDRAFT_679124 [Pisolithus microcarpus 441]|uniref:Uncharacterized protein n=1 Tax=Pisolithus microcarpus 441 TaxID=765257 RepID=A0A0C9ZCK6_9AGAM|nr:hypothetical protein PISMIDRAFT_679124 [Pisolithus microcarpus 441]